LSLSFSPCLRPSGVYVSALRFLPAAKMTSYAEVHKLLGLPIVLNGILHRSERRLPRKESTVSPYAPRTTSLHHAWYEKRSFILFHPCSEHSRRKRKRVDPMLRRLLKLVRKREEWRRWRRIVTQFPLNPRTGSVSANVPSLKVEVGNPTDTSTTSDYKRLFDLPSWKARRPKADRPYRYIEFPKERGILDTIVERHAYSALTQQPTRGSEEDSVLLIA
jgi:hypothetical protein